MMHDGINKNRTMTGTVSAKIRKIAVIAAVSALCFSMEPIHARAETGTGTIWEQLTKDKNKSQDKKQKEAVACKTAEEYVRALQKARESTEDGKYSSFKIPVTEELYEALSADDDKLLHELELRSGLVEVHYNYCSASSIQYRNCVFGEAFEAGNIKDVYDIVLACMSEGKCDEEIYIHLSEPYDKTIHSDKEQWTELTRLLRGVSLPASADLSSAGMLPVISVRIRGSQVTRMLGAYRDGDLSALSAEEKQALAVAEQWLAQVAPGSEKEVARQIHDIICRNTVYDGETDGKAAHSAVSVFLNGRAVCDGYAEAFYLLAAMAGQDVTIQSGVIDGTEVDTSLFADATNHAWNLVKIGGKWTPVDVTWDDSDSGFGYDYFCISFKELAKGRTWKYGPEKL